MERHMMIDKVTHDAGHENVAAHVESPIDDDHTTPLDANAVRWVIVLTVAFWWMVYVILRHI